MVFNGSRISITVCKSIYYKSPCERTHLFTHIHKLSKAFVPTGQPRLLRHLPEMTSYFHMEAATKHCGMFTGSLQSAGNTGPGEIWPPKNRVLR